MLSYTIFYVILSLQFIVKVRCFQVHENSTSDGSPSSKLQDNNLVSFSDLNSTSPILYPGVNKSDIHKVTHDSQIRQFNLSNDLNNMTFSALHEKNYSSTSKRENSQLRTRNTEEAPTNILEKHFVPSPEVKMRTNFFVEQTSSDSFQPIRNPEDGLAHQLSQTHINNLKVIPRTNFPFHINHLEKADPLRKTPQSYGFLTNLTEETKSMLFDKSKKKNVSSSKKFGLAADDEKIVPLSHFDIPKILDEKEHFDSDYFMPETKIVHDIPANVGDYGHFEDGAGDISGSLISFGDSNKNHENVEVKPEKYQPYPFEHVNKQNNNGGNEWPPFRFHSSGYGGELDATRPAKLPQYDSIPEFHGTVGYLPTPTAPLPTRPFDDEEPPYPLNWEMKHNRGKGVAKHESWKKIIHILSAIIPIGLLLSALTPNVVVINPNTTAGQLAKPIGSYNGGGLGGIGLGTGAGINFPQRQQRISDQSIENESDSTGLAEMLAILQERLMFAPPDPSKTTASTVEACREKIFCELANAGFFSKNGKFNNLLKQISSNMTDDTISYLSANWKTFRAAKESICSNYTCDPTTN